MFARFLSSIEVLESRIAPAGLITIDQSAGGLFFNGSEEAAKFRVDQVNAQTWLIQGFAGTLVQVGATGTAAESVLITAPLGGVTVNFGGGDDSVGFVGVKLKQSLTVNGGAGANSTFLTDVAAVGKVSVVGGAGNDQVTVSGYKSNFAQGMQLALADGNNSFKVEGTTASFTGLSYTGGIGNDAVDFSGGKVLVKGNLTVDGGTAGSSNVSLKPANLTVSGGVKLTDGAGNAKLFVQPGGSLRIAQALQIDGGAGDDDIRVGGGGLLTSIGSVKIDGGGGSTNSESISLKAGGLLNVLGAVSMSQTGGANTVALGGDVVKIGGSVTVDLGDNPNAPRGRFDLSATTSAKLAGNLEVTSGAGRFAHKIGSEGNITIAGKTSFTSTGLASGAQVSLNSDIGTAKFLGGLDLSVADGNFEAGLFGGAYLVGTDLKLSADGAGTSMLATDMHSLVVKGSVRATGSAETLALQVSTNAGLAVGQNVLVDGTGGRVDVDLNVASGKIVGQLAVTHNGAISEVDVTGRNSAVKIGQSLELLLSATTRASIALQGVSVIGIAKITTAGGADTLRIDDSIFGGAVQIDLGDGADTADLETRLTLVPAITLFKQAASFNMGAGDDVLRIGLADSSLTRGSFLAAATFTGGDGTNDRLTIDAQTTFRVSGQPTITGFEV
jgi:hypothetical protein